MHVEVVGCKEGRNLLAAAIGSRCDSLCTLKERFNGGN